jgi:hypothetical protein
VRERAFDTYVAVDWSARATRATGADSIWIAVLDAPGVPVLANPATRTAAEALLRACLAERSDRRVLVGIDVALGYPAGTAAALGLPDDEAPWRATWRRIAELLVDDERNANNRFEVAAALNRSIGGGAGPFWGCPAGRRYDGLAPTKPSTFPLAEFRAAERALRAAGRRPMSVWQLAGAGSVGSQTLTAIPVLERLLTEHADMAVWPFTTGLAVPSAATGGVVFAEVWPTAFDPPTPAGETRDAVQVRHVVERLCEADLDGSLAQWCAPPVDGPDGIDIAAVTGEEGWVLGPVERPLLR